MMSHNGKEYEQEYIYICIYTYIYIYMHVCMCVCVCVCVCVCIGFPGSSAGKESTCNAGDPSSIHGLGSSPGEGIGYPLQYSWASLVAQMVKNPPATWDTWLGSTPRLGISPGGGHGNPLQYSCLKNPHGQRSLAGYSPWGCKELDTAEGLRITLL